VLLGDLAAPRQVAADAWVRLLQMPVLPYVTISLIAGLGSLSAEQAEMPFTRVAAVFLAIWTLSNVLAFSNGTIDALRDYWVHGREAEPRRPRWSVVRNVLGRVD
jgi:Na+/H+-dicarboxylate symporter